MTEAKNGAVSWFDLTVADATGVRDFYEAVVGWKPSPVQMGDYDDYCMAMPGTDNVVAGICHARGSNAKLPPQWLIYISVEDLESSLQQCCAKGGQVLQAARDLGNGRMAVIKDPAGAVAALFQATDEGPQSET